MTNIKLTTWHYEVNRKLEHHLGKFMAMKTYAIVLIRGIKWHDMIEHHMDMKICPISISILCMDLMVVSSKYGIMILQIQT